ncbi:hypothetical protein Tco_0550227 [Tanacetum coccineum]
MLDPSQGFIDPWGRKFGRWSKQGEMLDREKIIGKSVAIGLEKYYCLEKQELDLSERVSRSGKLQSVDRSLLALRPSRLCAQARSEDGMPFHTQACKEYTRWVFCKLCGRPMCIISLFRPGSTVFTYGPFRESFQAIDLILPLANFDDRARFSTPLVSITLNQILGRRRTIGAISPWLSFFAKRYLRAECIGSMHLCFCYDEISYGEDNALFGHKNGSLPDKLKLVVFSHFEALVKREEAFWKEFHVDVKTSIKDFHRLLNL